MIALRPAAILFGSLLALAASSAGAATSLDFDKVFNDRGEPAQMHFAASYRLGAGEHRVEVWRERELRVRRRTDDAIETLVARPEGSLEWSMSVLDLKRRIRTEVERTNLFRIGHFTDWFALAHSLAHPVGAYTLAALPRGQTPHAAPVAACRWFALAEGTREGARTSKICWSSKHRVALVITDAADVVQWRVTAIDAGPLPDASFAVDDRGFVHNDANHDIQAD